MDSLSLSFFRLIVCAIIIRFKLGKTHDDEKKNALCRIYVCFMCVVCVSLNYFIAEGM